MLLSKNRNKLLIIGLWFMAFANLWHWLASRHWHLSDSMTDGIFGVFMGVAIGCLLISIARRRTSKCSGDPA